MVCTSHVLIMYCDPGSYVLRVISNPPLLSLSTPRAVAMLPVAAALSMSLNAFNIARSMF